MVTGKLSVELSTWFYSWLLHKDCHSEFTPPPSPSIRAPKLEYFIETENVEGLFQLPLQMVAPVKEVIYFDQISICPEKQYFGTVSVTQDYD